jgi:GNAT superfamily N-acetyltransferase
MKIILFENKYAERTSDAIRDALLQHKYNFRGTDRKLIEHDIATYTPAYLREHFNTKSAEYFLAVSDDGTEVYGIAGLAKDEIHTCYTAGKMQKMGIGTVLLTHIESIARSRKLKTLHVTANFYTEPFYSSCGFKLIKKGTVNWEGCTWPVVFMEKKL